MPAPIRIAHVALQLETGGMERLLVEFARCADRSRYLLHFVSLGTKGRVAQALEACGWPVTAFHARPGIRPSTIFRLARFFQDQQVQVVHTHNTKPLLYAGPAARLANVDAVIHTRHGQRQGSSARQDLLFRLAARCADRVVCVSDNSLRLSNEGGLDADSVRRIWNGIDRRRFAFAGPCPGGPALYVGRLSQEKDVATLLRATALVVRDMPTFRLQVAGAGACRETLLSLTGELGIGAHVEFLGEVRDVSALYARASLFVLPSLTEGLPLTALEAMSCGLPVVATAVGGTPEAVHDGTTGVLVPPGDPATLARAILRVWNDPRLASQMGRLGRDRVEQFFDVERMVSAYESLYEEVLGHSERAAA